MKNNSLRRAVVLLSGGLDSAVTLYSAIKQGYQAHCLIFDYGQRHNREIRSALSLAKRAGCAWDVLKIALPWKGSSLLDERMQIPQGVRVPECQSVKVSKCQSVSGIPSTYVPARKLIF